MTTSRNERTRLIRLVQVGRRSLGWMKKPIGNCWPSRVANALRQN